MQISSNQDFKASPSRDNSPRGVKREKLLPNVLINIIIPSLILMKGAKWFHFSPAMALVSAISFPILYGLYDLIVKRHFNLYAIIGFISIFLTGGIGLLELSKDWIAFKEAAVPFIIGIILIGSTKTKSPLIRVFLYNDSILNVKKVDAALKQYHHAAAFDRLMLKCTWLLATSFFLSAVLNYILAKVIIQSETGTEAFNAELGRMTLLSYPIIAIPCMIISMIALWRLLTGLRQLTHLTLEEIFAELSHSKSNSREKGIESCKE